MNVYDSEQWTDIFEIINGIDGRKCVEKKTNINLNSLSESKNNFVNIKFAKFTGKVSSWMKQGKHFERDNLNLKSINMV